ncbi:globin [Falsarthrobacter nasiphocae]|uniref:Hemoglobin n=1 Tax=Falsarthrobacter nasiphocae TaxID=189863 RepID=A0AAE3YHN9_9MICC|nr:globin [Falsarthrobacter nasiphocae]MDR6892907.1 hemoglobin [Falsarthrobacter nasiphocae]
MTTDAPIGPPPPSGHQGLSLTTAKPVRRGPAETTFYEQVGGHETFVKLVDVFYGHVEEDPDFRALYPEEDLAPAKRRLLMFLEQYWGGPTTYSEERGHPRLRMRHAPFVIDEWARDTWLKYMRAAVDSLSLSPLHEATLWDYMDRAAHSLLNAPGGDRR